MAEHRFGSLLLRTLTVLLALSLTLTAPAQGFLDWNGSKSGCNQTFCSNGTPVIIERFTPQCCGQAPAVILLHGADGLSGRFGQLYRTAAQLLADSGYNAFIIHYLNTTGTSPAEAAQVKQNPAEFGVWMRAVSDAISYVSCQPGVDPRRVGLLGFSLGGFLATSVATVDPRVTVLVEYGGGLPPQFARGAANLPPTLIIHGQADKTVPVSQAYQMKSMLSRAKVQNHMIIYPGQGHAMDESAQMDAAGRVRAFLAQNL